VVAVKQGKEMTVGGLVQIRAGEAATLCQQLLELGHASTCMSMGGEAVRGSGGGRRSKQADKTQRAL
jgi:hypothetical protein